MKKKKKSFNVLKIFGVIFLISTALVLLLIGSFMGWFWWKSNQDKKIEQVILKEFYADVKNNPAITVNSFMLWEGDSIAEVAIKEKGIVRMWYGEDNIPIISNIGDYSTSYTCYYVDSNGQKKNYAYDLEMDLSKNSQLKKWFPFEVNTLKDLVTRYDEIITILKTFPANPELVDFKDKTGSRYIRKTVDKDFIVKMTHNNKPVECDLYTQVYKNTTQNLCNHDSDCVVVPKQESYNACCPSCDEEAISKTELKKRDIWKTNNCDSMTSMCHVNDCYREELPVAQCIAGTCQLQWKER